MLPVSPQKVGEIVPKSESPIFWCHQQFIFKSVRQIRRLHHRSPSAQLYNRNHQEVTKPGVHLCGLLHTLAQQRNEKLPTVVAKRARPTTVTTV